MLTFRAGKFAALAFSLVCLAACSREQQDWRSAEASDSVEGYARFLKQHPDSELVTAARTRFAQLAEDREWQQAGEVDTADAYKQFLAQHPNGKWAQEARIRIENFALGAEGAAAANAPSGAGSVAVGSSAAAGMAAASLPNGGAAGPGAVGSGAPSGTPGGAATGASSAAVSSGAAVVSAGELARAPSPAPVMSGAAAAQAPATPNASAGAPTPAPLVAGEAAQAPTSPSPPTYRYAQPTALTQTPSSVGAAWRSADSGATAYGVQLGAFASENAATSEWGQLTARFSAQLRGLVPHVVSAETTTGRLFRLQALVADEATARALCDMLRKQSQACVPVLPH